MDSISERFVHAMSGIEQWLAATFPLKHLNNPDFARRLSEAVQLQAISEHEYRELGDLWKVRGILVHEHYRGRPPISASLPGLVRVEHLLEQYTGTIPRVSLLAKDRKSVTTTRPTARLGEALAVMREKDYSSLPVVDDHDRFIALLTNDDVVHWLADHLSEHGIVEEVPVAQVMHAGGPDVTFVPRDLPQRDARRIFQRSVDDHGAPLMAMLITMTGHAHEPLLGILTPWDLPQLTPAPFDARHAADESEVTTTV
jgi:CBS domain-containing protein